MIDAVFTRISSLFVTNESAILICFVRTLCNRSSNAN